LGAKETEHLHIGSNQDAPLLTVAEHRRVEEVAIQSAQNIGTADHGSMNHRIVVGVRRHDAGRRSWKDDLRYFLCTQVAEVLGYLKITQPYHGPNAIIREHPLQFHQKEWGEKQDMLRRIYDDLEKFPAWTFCFGVRPNEDVGIQNDPHVRPCRT
jgi:hypothetical protein